MPRVSGASLDTTVEHSVELGAYVAGLAWSPTGDAVAVATDDGSVGTLATDGDYTQRIEHAGGALAVAWGPSSVLASGGRDGRLALDGRVVGDGARWIERLAWRPDGERLAVAAGRRVEFWSPDGERKDTSDDFAATVTCLDWHPNGVLCAAGSYGGARLLRANGAAIAQRLDWTGSVLELAISPDGRRLVHGNQDASVHFWDLRKVTELEMTGYDTKVRELGWSADGRWLATGGGTTATLWDFARRRGPAGSRPLELDRHEDRITALAFEPGGELLATTGRDGRLLVWRPSLDDLPLSMTELDVPITTLAWSPDGQRIAVGTSVGGVAIVEIRR